MSSPIDYNKIIGNLILANTQIPPLAQSAVEYDDDWEMQEHKEELLKEERREAAIDKAVSITK